jgi:hypothetical protein
MELYATNGTTLIFSNDDASPTLQGPSRIEYVPPTSGTYYVKVTDYNNASGTANNYTLTLSSRSTCNNYEPDDQNASLIQIGTAQAHAFCVAADTDTAYFTVTTAGTYRIRTFGLARPQTNTILELQNNANAVLAQDDDSGGNGASMIQRTLAVGTYYVVLYQFDDKGGATYTYNVAVEQIAAAAVKP